jgi:ABC-2 type transport system ATP-binding protein
MISVNKLSKYFSDKRALGPVSFEIGDGESVGFLGLNGAGKTTALRILACDLRPSSGSVTVGKVDALANPHEVRKQIGFLPESTPLYNDMTVHDYLTFAGRLRGMTASKVKARLPAVLEVTDLGEVEHEIIRNLSHGYKQRVGVGQAIVHEPKLLILDEPTRGLDPVQIVEMRNMIQELKQAHTVLISSHILTEISQTCDRLLILGEGEIIAAGSEDALSSDLLETKRVEVTVRGDDDAVAKAEASATALTGVEELTRAAGDSSTTNFVLTCSDDVRADICRAFVESGCDVLELGEARGELETIFLSLVQGGTRARN